MVKNLIITGLAIAFVIAVSQIGSDTEAAPKPQKKKAPVKREKEAPLILSDDNTDLVIALEHKLAMLQNENIELHKSIGDLREEIKGYEEDFKSMDEELVISFGKKEEIPSQFGEALRGVMYMEGENYNRKDPDFENKRKEAFLNLFSIGPYIEEFEKIENKPNEFATAQSEMLSTMLQLDDEKRDTLEEIIRSQKTLLQDIEEGSDEYKMIINGANERFIEMMDDHQKKIFKRGFFSGNILKTFSFPK